METQFSLDPRKICTPPVTGSSISPVSPATLDRRLARTSAAAVSNYRNTHTKFNTTRARIIKREAKKTTHQRQVVSGRLPDLVGELGVEGVEVLGGDGDMVAVVHQALAGPNGTHVNPRWGASDLGKRGGGAGAL
jgi:hypothetical protein